MIFVLILCALLFRPEIKSEVVSLLFCYYFFRTEAVVSSGRVEKSPHEQEIKFFAKVSFFIYLCFFRGCQRMMVVTESCAEVCRD